MHHQYQLPSIPNSPLLYSFVPTSPPPAYTSPLPSPTPNSLHEQEQEEQQEQRSPCVNLNTMSEYSAINFDNYRNYIREINNVNTIDSPLSLIHSNIHRNYHYNNNAATATATRRNTTSTIHIDNSNNSLTNNINYFSQTYRHRQSHINNNDDCNNLDIDKISNNTNSVLFM